MWRRLSAPQLLAGSFLALIAAGTAGLLLLPGIYTGERLGFLDALFTATSAVCVTGLIVVDTATFFTPAGQAFLLLLIQLGGLGMITLATVIFVALGRRLSLRHEAAGAGGADLLGDVDMRRLARDVVRFTFALEAAGALVLYLLWAPRMGWGAAAWPAVFHSISAFCNAGFSVFSDSLMGFQLSPASLLVVMLLVVVGGIGFVTLEEVRLAWGASRRGSSYRITVHSRLVLATTAALLVAGWLLFALFEWRGALAGMPAGARIVNALFMSVTARTAGFNTIDYGTADDATNFLTILLMSIGGAPASTAGGLKVTTFALIGLLAWARLRGWPLVSVWRRSVPEETVQRAVGLFVLAFGIVTAGIFVYTATELRGTTLLVEQAGFLHYMFEAVSAFNTVGLSMGVTGELSSAGRLLTIVLMFVGRIGPLALAAAIALRSERARGFRYSYQDVMIG